MSFLRKYRPEKRESYNTKIQLDTTRDPNQITTYTHEPPKTPKAQKNNVPQSNVVRWCEVGTKRPTRKPKTVSRILGGRDGGPRGFEPEGVLPLQGPHLRDGTPVGTGTERVQSGLGRRTGEEGHSYTKGYRNRRTVVDDIYL